MSFAKSTACGDQRATFRNNKKQSHSLSVPSNPAASSKTSGVFKHPAMIVPKPGMEVPRQTAKPGKLKVFPVRQTLTSKLRMEKANPLLPSTSGENETFQAVETPVRRSTFYPGMLQVKKKLDLKFPVTESRTSLRKSIANSEKKVIGSSLFKENKPPHNSTNLKSEVFNKKKVTLSHDKNCTSSSKRHTTLNPNPKKCVGKHNLNATVGNKVIPSCTLYSSDVNVTKSKLLNNNKMKGTESRKQITHCKTTDSRNQNSVSNKSVNPPERKQLKSILRKSASVGDLRKVTLKDEELGELSAVENSSNAETRSILNRRKSVMFRSPLNSTSFSPINSANTPPPSILRKRLDDWLTKRGKSPTTFHQLRFFGLPANSTVTLSKGNLNEKQHCLKESATVVCKNEGPILPDTFSPDVHKDETNQRLDETITLESHDSTFTLSASPEVGKEIDVGNNPHKCPSPPDGICTILEQEKEVGIENCAPQGSSTPEKSCTRSEQEKVDSENVLQGHSTNENHFTISNPSEDKENNEFLAHPEALGDLRKLIRSGYPRDQCEQWLHFISKSHPEMKEFPQYWECMAALEEARGEFGSAVACYERAVVKGANAEDVDDHLDDLWEKLNAMSINSSQNKRSSKNPVVDPKQLFKSTIIKFALQQKAVKKFSKEKGVSLQSVSYIVTPVRRSSRKSMSRFKTSPTVKCVDTLDNLDPNIKECMEFRGNNVLFPEN